MADADDMLNRTGEARAKVYVVEDCDESKIDPRFLDEVGRSRGLPIIARAVRNRKALFRGVL
jgi:hypothetical protein